MKNCCRSKLSKDRSTAGLVPNAQQADSPQTRSLRPIFALPPTVATGNGFLPHQCVTHGATCLLPVKRRTENRARKPAQSLCEAQS